MNEIDQLKKSESKSKSFKRIVELIDFIDYIVISLDNANLRNFNRLITSYENFMPI